MSSKKILVIDESKEDSKVIKYVLEKYKYKVDISSDPDSAYEKFQKKNYDMVICEYNLSNTDGVSLSKKIRENSICPIIIVSSNDDIYAKVMALDSGVDDYITKPFNKSELRARINAVLRRVGPNNSFMEKSIVQVDDLKINTIGRVVDISGRKTSLTAKEFDLLVLLAMHRGEVYSREQLLEKIWGYEYFADVRTVDVHIRRLRKKIEKNPSIPNYILTKWGMGYYFKPDSESDKKLKYMDSELLIK